MPHVLIAVTDTIVVNGMTGVIDAVEHRGYCTVVRLG
jgi:hypothetical protein